MGGVRAFEGLLVEEVVEPEVGAPPVLEEVACSEGMIDDREKEGGSSSSSSCRSSSSRVS